MYIFDVPSTEWPRGVDRDNAVERQARIEKEVATGYKEAEGVEPAASKKAEGKRPAAECPTVKNPTGPLCTGGPLVIDDDEPTSHKRRRVVAD